MEKLTGLVLQLNSSSSDFIFFPSKNPSAVIVTQATQLSESCLFLAS